MITPPTGGSPLPDAAATRSLTATVPGDRRVVLVTGLAGAGRTTALRALEDLGYEAVDNLPLPLLPHLIAGVRSTIDDDRPIAIGIDSRSTGFDAGLLLDRMAELRLEERLRAQLLFLDCIDDVLLRRFTETRRRHPLAPDRPVVDGIAQERSLMQPIKAAADLLIDTSDCSIADLKRWIGEQFLLSEDEAGLSLTVMSFSYRHGLPREADLVFDVRFLRNPHYDPVLRPLDGEAPEVGAFISADPAFTGFFTSLSGLVWPLLPDYQHEGKSYLTIAIGCTGGKHRSVYTARRLADWLRERGCRVVLRHRDLRRDQPDQPAADETGTKI